MQLNNYQKQAMETCVDASRNISYMLLNLVGEVGEFSSKLAKAIRKDKASIENNKLRLSPLASREDNRALETALKLEAGDILWQLSGLCSVCGWTLEDVAQANLDKLADRKQRNVIVGEGDYR